MAVSYYTLLHSLDKYYITDVDHPYTKEGEFISKNVVVTDISNSGLIMKLTLRDTIDFMIRTKPDIKFIYPLPGDPILSNCDYYKSSFLVDDKARYVLSYLEKNDNNELIVHNYYIVYKNGNVKRKQSYNPESSCKLFSGNRGSSIYKKLTSIREFISTYIENNIKDINILHEDD